MIVHFATEAERDLEAIGDFIARDNPARAITFIRELRARCLDLAESPRRFPLVPDFEAHGVRRRLYGSYLIFYRVTDDRVVVVHILHGASDYAAVLAMPD